MWPQYGNEGGKQEKEGDGEGVKSDRGRDACYDRGARFFSEVPQFGS